ncbi:PAQR family membrane homeostasis protein TrhA [Lapidilactobacillus luobeiensis]|uniref:PAQR family membrane homeostasis protein TrhA n=1 Tax=Lapidilactobacillus luobeiensis TaxID=2950371 RepID=UPI0021C3A02B|nr:hemolysin III family protein [Lapidilactobacillus luobeiensis]
MSTAKKLFTAPQHPTRRYLVLNEIFSAITHGIGVGLAITALVLLVLKAGGTHDTLRIVTFSVYGASLVVLYLCSTLYHSLIFTRARHVFQIFDHSSIFILIAGTYTPYTLVAIGGWQGWTMFGAIWGLALLGILYKIFVVGKHPIFETVLYVVMGWIVIISAKPLAATIGQTGLWLLIAGGIAYTFGALLYSMRGIKFIHVIWHLFVLLGSILMFFSVYLYV